MKNSTSEKIGTITANAIDDKFQTIEKKLDDTYIKAEHLKAIYTEDREEVTKCIHTLFESFKLDHDRLLKLEAEIDVWKSICAVLFGAIITYLIFNYFFI